jgi:hypothetical protein
MFKRMLIVFVLLGVASGLLTRDATAGPPWPAEVIQIRDGDFCNFPWMNSNYELITLTGPGIWVAQYHSGQLQWNCHTSIDFADPYLLSVQEVCAIAPDLCNGNGTFIWREDSVIPLACVDLGLVANDNIMVVNPSGQANIICHFNMGLP